MKIERIHFAGWEDCVQLTHGDMTLIVTTAVGPRIIYCALKDKGNLFYVNYDQAGSSGGEEWKTYGGHRFWCAPEDLDFTYAPDNAPVQVIESGHGVRLTAPVEKSGVMKTIEISPVVGQNRVRLEHIVQNMGRQTLRLAPWALSVMCTGGVAVIPHNLERPHDLLPTHSLSLWGTPIRAIRAGSGANVTFFSARIPLPLTPKKPVYRTLMAGQDTLFGISSS